MEKIEFVEVNGNELPLSFFPTEVKNMVSTFEIVRTEYNKSAVNTQALSEYMQRLSQQIQGLAEQHVAASLAPQVAPVAPVVHLDEDEPAELVDQAE